MLYLTSLHNENTPFLNPLISLISLFYLLVSFFISLYLRGSHDLSAWRVQRTESRGPKGLQLEVRTWRAPRLLVNIICRMSYYSSAINECQSFCWLVKSSRNLFLNRSLGPLRPWHLLDDYIKHAEYDDDHWSSSIMIMIMVMIDHDRIVHIW